MRNALTAMVGMAFFLAAGCGGKGGGGSNGSNGSGSGGTSGLFGNGYPCGADDQCVSNVCGTEGTGNCCAGPCEAQAGQICSVPQGCDDGGRCEYPIKGTDCGTSCSVNTLTTNTCDGAGGCTPGTTTTCQDNASCGATACNGPCTDDGGCAVSFYCANISSSTHEGTCISQIPNGEPCNGPGQCAGIGNICGANDLCCKNPCASDGTPECMASNCSDAGACLYPKAGTLCDTADESCTGSTQNAGTCDGVGDCIDGGIPCANNYACNANGSGCIQSSCLSNVQCAAGFYCVVDETSPKLGECLPKVADGGCAGDYECISGSCGINGNCCLATCTSTFAGCAASGCDGTTEECLYVDAGTSCGVAVSCNTTTNVQGNPAICDGMGNCPKPGMTNCPPFVCSGSGTGFGCFTSCTDATSCIAGDFCDTVAGACCAPVAGTSIHVDAAIGKDAACCGIGVGANPCATINYAMKLIDSSQTKNVGIAATVNGGAGGDWTSAGEVYPIVLGWGVELSAPGVNFYDPNSVLQMNPVVSTAIFDIAPFSKVDTIGYASIIGGPAGSVGIGANTKGNLQSTDKSAIQVEAGNTLYLASATVNGNAAATTAAITVLPGATLTVGGDETGSNLGTVTIGSTQGNLKGWSGIVCGSPGATKTCAVNDVAQAMNGDSSLDIVNQESVDIDAEDGASISLTAVPVIGLAPNAAGIGKCLSKIDASKAAINPAAILLRGMASLSFSESGTVQCISGQAFRLVASTLGTPSLTLSGVTVTNTELGVYASAGAATITNSMFEYNYNGVQQDTDGTHTASVDLGGGGNMVFCSSVKESTVVNETTPGVGVLNTTSSVLNAADTEWNTTGPDEFDCNAGLTMCNCTSGMCTNGAGDDDMDAVYEVAGATVNTMGGTQSAAAAAAGCK